MDTLPTPERYTYVFEGNSQVLDQILVSRKLDKRNTCTTSSTSTRSSSTRRDHDPQVARFLFDDD